MDIDKNDETDKITNGNGEKCEKEKLENIKSEGEERTEDESEEDEEENGNDHNDESSSLSESDGSESENRFVPYDFQLESFLLEFSNFSIFPNYSGCMIFKNILVMQLKAKMTNQILRKILKKQQIL